MEGVQRVRLRTYLKQNGEFQKPLGITGIRKRVPRLRGQPLSEAEIRSRTWQKWTFFRARRRRGKFTTVMATYITEIYYR